MNAHRKAPHMRFSISEFHFAVLMDSIAQLDRRGPAYDCPWESLQSSDGGEASGEHVASQAGPRRAASAARRRLG